MNYYKFYCVIFYTLFSLSFIACSSGNDVPEPTPTPQPTPTPAPSDKVDVTSKPSAAIQTAGGDATIEFTASADWSASTSADWISISPTSGTAGSAKITVKVAENTTYDERNGSVTIKSGTASQNITITQKQKDAIILTSSKVEVNAEAGEATIEVKANVDYTFEIEESAKSWISAPQTRGLTASTIKLSVAENDGVNKREGKITITSGSLSEVVTIYQAGAKASIVISQNEYHIASSGDVIKVELQSNCDYEIRMPNVDWISKADTRAVSTYTHYFNVAENTTYDQREASIVFVNKENNIEESVKITQERNERYAEHEYVDLGLPDGTLWATCNIGASKPEEYGDYFAWGETKPKMDYSWETYKWGNGGFQSKITKYSVNVDNKSELDVEDDAAYVNWGSNWRMPTWQQCVDLFNRAYTTSEWTNINGVKGLKITSKKYPNRFIFLPTAGLRDSSFSQVGKYGYYWSSTLNTSNGDTRSLFARYLCFGDYDISHFGRNEGYSVRPVKAMIVISQKEYFVASSGDVIMVVLQSNSDYEIRMPNVDWISKAETRALSSSRYYFKVSENKTSTQREAEIVFANRDIEQSIKITQGVEIDGHGYVDLGLSVKWAACNIGASKPEDYGDYFAWGETTPKSVYDWNTYKWCNGEKNGQTKYCVNKSEGTVDNKKELDLEDDAAYVNWGGTWRIPTEAELKELINRCTWTSSSKGGHNGYVVTGPNGNSIFLPAAGYRVDTGGWGKGKGCYYWSSRLSLYHCFYAECLCYYSSLLTNGFYRSQGFPIRPVTE